MKSLNPLPQLRRLTDRLLDAYFSSWGTTRVLEEEDIPAEPRPGRLYLVGENGRFWIAAMRCPCGCSEPLEMNLLPDAKPVWQFAVDKKGRPSLHPSVWRDDGCRAHFFLRRGKITWC